MEVSSVFSGLSSSEVTLSSPSASAPVLLASDSELEVADSGITGMTGSAGVLLLLVLLVELVRVGLLDLTRASWEVTRNRCEVSGRHIADLTSFASFAALS